MPLIPMIDYKILKKIKKIKTNDVRICFTFVSFVKGLTI